MDNKPMEHDEWFDELLGKAPETKELGPDESAVYSAGLIHPDDVELEAILAEHRQMEMDMEAILAEQRQAELEAEISAAVESVLAEEMLNAESTATVQAVSEPPAVKASAPAAPVTATQPEYVQNDIISYEETQYFSPAEREPLDTEEASTVVDFEDEAGTVSEEYEYDDLPIQEEEKGRPRRKKGYGLLGLPHVAATCIWAGIILLVGISLGRILWLCCSDLMAFGKNDREAVITIEDGDTIDTISQKLADQGLVRYPGLFVKFAELTGKVDNISVGTFTLNSRLDYNAMINGMSAHAPAREEVDVMFPEGYTCAQIFALLEEKGVCTVAELEAYAANGELDDYWFLEGVERGHKYCLEGYLFPDTYKFYTNDDPRRVLEKFLNCFDDRFTDIMRERLEAINNNYAEWLRDEGFSEEYIASHPITIREAVIIASLIEKESSGGLENYQISSVIYNRLTDSSQPPYLNIDAALIYGLGGKTDPVTGETIPLTDEDLKIDNPYNTYLYAGLTPGAICNPGQECLNAALEPDDTDYYYYALDPETGTHKFFKTYKEHQKFLNSLDD